MKYIIYKDMPLVDGEVRRVYMQDYGLYTTEKENAKKITVRNVLEILLIVLQIILKYFEIHKFERI